MLHRGDYRETLALCEGRADLVFTSPPYCDARSYGADVSWSDGDYAELGDAVFSAVRPGGYAVVNVDAPVREWRPGFGSERGFHPWRMMLDWGERVGFRVVDRLFYGRRGIPGGYPGRFRNDVEPMLWFQRPGGEGFLDKRSIARPGAENYVGRVPNRRLGESPQHRAASGWAAENMMVMPGTLWDLGRTGNGQSGAVDLEAQRHPARWPYRLAEDLVRCFCPPDGLACDPFLGAGTSLIAALEHGRRFVGGDLYVRPDDGMPWIDVAAGVADRRFAQVRMFGAGA